MTPLYAYWTFHQQNNSQSVKSQIGQLMAVNSPTSLF